MVLLSTTAALDVYFLSDALFVPLLPPKVNRVEEFSRSPLSATVNQK